MSGKLSTAAVLIISVFTAVLDLIIFKGVHYIVLMVVLTMLACLPFFTSDSCKRAFAKELWIIIVSSLFSSAALLISSVFGFYKPYTSVVIASGMFFGSPVGFACGFFSALIYSLISGIGGWSVYQMMALGIIGFIAGSVRKKLSLNTTAIIIFTIISSVAYSCTNIMYLIWESGKGFDFSSYSSILFHSIKWFVLYAATDVMTVLLIKKHLIRKMFRLKRRFRVFEYGRKRF